MKKILFISSLDITGDRLKYDGVTKKIMLEIMTLSTFGYQVDYLYAELGFVYLRKDIDTSILLGKQEKSFHKTMINVYNQLRKLLLIGDIHYDLLYVRYEHISFSMILFFKSFKNKFSEIKIISELPTYMKKWEPGSSLKIIVSFIIKRCLDIGLPKYIDKMVTFDNQKRIFGIPTICIENFVDISSMPVKKVIIEKGELHLLGVAMMTPSHGFDRMIRGMEVYYRSNPSLKVYFHIVGEGEVKAKWEKLATNLKLKDYVFFEGVKKGDELDSMFDLCQIGVASLAIFRKKCKKASELKIREYIARGLPFIYSANEPLISRTEFCLKVSHDESPININSVIEFYNGLHTESLRSKMRKFAEQECTCQGQLEKVFKIL